MISSEKEIGTYVLTKMLIYSIIAHRFRYPFGSDINPNRNFPIWINIGTKKKSEPIDKITVLHICISDCGSDIFFSKFSIGEHYYRLSYLVHMFNQATKCGQ